MNLLNENELTTLLAMAEACETPADARDTISLYALLDESLKPQLKQALRVLPAEIKELLRGAVAERVIAGRAA